MKRLDCVPAKKVPDWKALAELAKEHGAVLLPLKALTYTPAHACLHRFGVGIFMAMNEAGEHVGWRIAPLSRKNERKKHENQDK